MKTRINPNAPERESHMAFDFMQGSVRLVVVEGSRRDTEHDRLATLTMTAEEADETAELLRQFADLARNGGRTR